MYWLHKVMHIVKT